MADYPHPDRLKRHAVRAAAALLCSLCLCETAFCGTIPLEDQRCRTTYEIFVYSFCDSDADGIGDLPAANVVEFCLEGGNKVIVRPSGTEPKIKVYLFAKRPTRELAAELLAALAEAAHAMLG